MCCVQTTLEIRKFFHERPRVLPWGRINRLSRVEIPDEARKETLRCARCFKREMYTLMHNVACEVTYLIPRKCS